MTISYRMLAAIVGVVLLFGVGAAFIIDGDDDDNAADPGTTVTIDRNDEGGVKTEDDDEDTTTSSTARSTTTTSTTTASSTTSTTAGGSGSATTSTTRRSGSATTTTRPGSTTTTRPPTTTQPPVTNPPITSPPPTQSSVADLAIHSNSSATSFGRTVSLSIENEGPGGGVDFTLTINGGGAPVRAFRAGSGFNCNSGGSTVTCTASDVGVGGTVRQVSVDFDVDEACTGLPALTANVSSSNRSDPNSSNNNYVRSLCRAAPNN